jgi:hypothetical protein
LKKPIADTALAGWRRAGDRKQVRSGVQGGVFIIEIGR